MHASGAGGRQCLYRAGYALTVALSLAGCATVPPARVLHDEDDFVPLFNGRNLDGWEIVGRDTTGWFVDGEALACKGGHGAWIRYEEILADFVLRLQFRIEKDGNSGIFLRQYLHQGTWRRGWEVQVFDSHALGFNHPNVHSAGAAYDVLTPMLNAARPPGEWNDVEIECRGTRVRVVWNGYKVIDYDFGTLTEPIGKFEAAYADKPLAGCIGFQDHGHPVWYRNVRVKRL